MKEIKCAFKIPKADLLAMRELQGKDETRYVLCGVNFEVTKKHVILTATNGRLIGVLLADVPPDDLSGITGKIEFTCDYPMVRYLPQSEAKDGMVSLFYDGHEIAFSSRSQTVTCTAIKGNYPKWRTVVPKGKIIPTHYNFNPGYLLQFHRAAKLLLPKDNAVMLRGHDYHSHADESLTQPPYSVFFNTDRFYGALMPVRCHNEPAVPEWMKEAEEKAEEKPTPKPDIQPAPAKVAA